MTTFEIYKNVINSRTYRLEDLEERIETVYAAGKITADERVALLNMAAEQASDAAQVDIAAAIANLDARVRALEAAGVVVWTYGHQTGRGETVLYAILAPTDTTLRYCRYDGKRSYTTLSPGKIEGWVVLGSAGGEVTHTVSKDADGKIILVPVDGASSNE